MLRCYESLQLYFSQASMGFLEVTIIILLIRMKRRGEEDQSEEYSDQQNQQQKREIRKPKIERIDKFKNLKKIVINISMTQYPVVTEVAESLKWKVQESNDAGDWDVYWTDFAIDTDILIKMHLFQKINHYPGMHVLARKNLLGLNLMALRSKFLDQYNFFPLTWMLPMQYAQFRAYYETKQKGKARTYIAKPEHECQGRGIFMTRKIEDLQTGKHYVVQRYLARPFLLEGLKFDLRIYVLLCGTNPLRLYMYNQGLARLATETYAEPTTSNLEKPYIHLTNYAINKNNPKFVFNNSSNNMGVGHKRSITCVYKQLAAMGLNIQELKAKINDVAIKTIICGVPLMSHQYKCSQPEDYSGNMCFHILGLDIILNNKAQPILLEVNHTPSFTTDTPLDHQIKFNLIKDTLKLMNINAQTKNELFNKAKELNKERLMTGKRQIFEGKERQTAINEAQALRDEYEDQNVGGYTKIFPVKDQELMKKYNQIIESATKTYIQESGSIRAKMMEKQAKKLAKQDYKQMKAAKQARSEKAKEEGEMASSKLKPTKKQTQSQTQIKPSESENKSQLDDREQQQSNGDLQALTRSENNIERQNQLSNNTELVPNLIKKYSENNQPTFNSNSIIAIKKLQSSFSIELANQPEEPLPKQSRIKNYPKSTSIRKVNLKEQSLADRMHSVHQSNPKERIKSITTSKTTVKKQIAPIHQNQLPNIIDCSINNPNASPLQRKDDKIQSVSRHQNLRAANRSGKISEYAARDIRDILEKKSNNVGNFIMPKIMNLNIDNQRRATDVPQYCPRKGNIFYHNQ